MDANFADLTWDDVVIKHGSLKAIWEYPVKDLKHKDLCTVCNRLKIKGVKNTLRNISMVNGNMQDLISNS